MKYEIIYSKTKNWRIKLMPDMSLKISIPLRKSKDKVFEELLLNKWRLLIEKFEKKWKKKLEDIGEDYVMIFWEKVETHCNASLQKEIKWDLNKYLKEKLYSETLPILENYSMSLNKSFNKLYIKNVLSRWWSCSGSNNITINLKLVHLPIKYLNYVIIHEACHLREKNHSSKFWDLVAIYCPDYKELRKELKNILF